MHISILEITMLDLEQLDETQLLAVCCFVMSRLTHAHKLLNSCGTNFLEIIAVDIDSMSDAEKLIHIQKAVNRLVEMKNTQEVWSGE
ncbi:hypothetical protein NIES4074_24140 [Cylindrospermum sp. NIES-4074]|nr:hypothetical protein NIES4074_24140 [Cylindrospermum sp. NIES-4074]